MTRAEAKSLIKNLIALLGDNGLEWERRSDLVMLRFIELGMLAVDPDQPPKETLTLWKMLRNHGVGLYTAQMICNDVMLNGVTLPQSPQVTTESNNG